MALSRQHHRFCSNIYFFEEQLCRNYKSCGGLHALKPSKCASFLQILVSRKYRYKVQPFISNNLLWKQSFHNLELFWSWGQCFTFFDVFDRLVFLCTSKKIWKIEPEQENFQGHFVLQFVQPLNKNRPNNRLLLGGVYEWILACKNCYSDVLVSIDRHWDGFSAVFREV